MKRRLLACYFFIFIIVSVLSSSPGATVVYITNTGAKYHLESCHTLRSSKIPISLSEAVARGLEPCGICNPSTITEQNVSSTTALQDSIARLEIPLLRDGDVLISHTGFSLVYDEEHEQAEWVAYELTMDEVHGVYARADNFRADPSIPTRSASLADYRGYGYDRGHLIPAADLKWSVEAMADSFYMSNMSPQVPAFNRGVWSKLEAVVRTFAVVDGAINVVTGPILTNGPFPSIGENAVSIPYYYFKVILDYKEPGLKAIGFILPNEGSTLPLTTYATTVDQVESITGFDFFYLLPDNLEEILESQFDISLWDFS